jgi:Tfp pilus assembly protein PilV
MKHVTAKQRGASLVEVLVAIALSSIMLPAFAEAALTARAAQPAAAQHTQALSLEREAMEAVRSVREQSWSTVASDGTYHPVISTDHWTLAAGSEAIGNLTRQIVISDVNRDSSGAIVASGGTADPATKLVTVTVSWSTPIASSISTDTYLTHWTGNASWVQTTQADFNAGILVSVITTNTSGGEVELDNAGNLNASGTYESPTFDAGAAADFNALTFTAAQPTGTSVTFQIATNNDNATWNYVGPDGTASSSYSSPGAIPLSAADGRYFRYKATLTATGTMSVPVIDDVTIDYSL